MSCTAGNTGISLLASYGRMRERKSVRSSPKSVASLPDAAKSRMGNRWSSACVRQLRRPHFLLFMIGQRNSPHAYSICELSIAQAGGSCILLPKRFGASYSKRNLFDESPRQHDFVQQGKIGCKRAEAHTSGPHSPWGSLRGWLQVAMRAAVTESPARSGWGGRQ